MTTTQTEAEEAADAIKTRFLNAFIAEGLPALTELVQAEAHKARNSADYKAVTHFLIAVSKTQKPLRKFKHLYAFLGAVAEAIERFIMWEFSGEARTYFYDNYAF